MSDNKDYSATYNMGQEILRLEAKIKELESQLEQAKKDQERYQWLLDRVGAVQISWSSAKWIFSRLPKCTSDVFEGNTAQQFSEAIDAAMQEGK